RRRGPRTRGLTPAPPTSTRPIQGDRTCAEAACVRSRGAPGTAADTAHRACEEPNNGSGYAGSSPPTTLQLQRCGDCGLTPELSRAAKRQRLERTVRPRTGRLWAAIPNDLFAWDADCVS